MHITVDIGRKGNKQLAPKDSSHTKNGVTTARIGDVVTFTVPGKEPVLDFPQGSPFARRADYGVELQVVKKGRFRYVCRATIDGVPLGTDDESGGEMEILQG